MILYDKKPIGEKMIKSLFLLIIYLCTFDGVAAGWEVKSRINYITDENRKSAFIKNADGHTLSIYRISEGGSVWANFALSDKSFDQLDSENPPIYRIDKNEPSDLSFSKKMTEETSDDLKLYEWRPKWINFRIWHGNENKGLSKDVRYLMNGKEIVFRYYIFSGGYKYTSFSLKGAGPVISSALDISQKEDNKK